MNSPKDLSDEEILKMIEEIGKRQYRALERYEHWNYNKLFDKLKILVLELKARPGDRRILLTHHYGHSNIQVWLNAATHTLVVAPEEARAQLQAIVDTKYYPQAADAGMRLDHLASGFFKPT